MSKHNKKKKNKNKKHNQRSKPSSTVVTDNAQQPTTTPAKQGYMCPACKQCVKTPEENTALPAIVHWLQRILALVFHVERILWGLAVIFSAVFTIAFIIQWSAENWFAVILCSVFTVLVCLICIWEFKDTCKRIKETKTITSIGDLFGLLATVVALITLAYATISFAADAPQTFSKLWFTIKSLFTSLS